MMEMSFNHNKTFELWKSFMPRRKEIAEGMNDLLYSVQVYYTTFDIINFNPDEKFVKWATVEIPSQAKIPEGMNELIISGGVYAVFRHRGAGKTAPATYQFIFGTWLPNSGYRLDNRPHLEVLGDKYKNDDPDSEEEMWIPITAR